MDEINLLTNEVPSEGMDPIADAIEDFRRNGVAVARGLFRGPEVAALQHEASRLWGAQEGLEIENLRVGLRKNAAGEVVLERLDPVADISEMYADLSNSHRQMKIAELALGEPVTVQVLTAPPVSDHHQIRVSRG